MEVNAIVVPTRITPTAPRSSFFWGGSSRSPPLGGKDVSQWDFEDLMDLLNDQGRGPLGPMVDGWFVMVAGGCKDSYWRCHFHWLVANGGLRLRAIHLQSICQHPLLTITDCSNIQAVVFPASCNKRAPVKQKMTRP